MDQEFFNKSVCTLNSQKNNLIKTKAKSYHIFNMTSISSKIVIEIKIN